MTTTKNTNYSEYTARINFEPSYYGSEVTNREAIEIAHNLEKMIPEQFPGIKIETRSSIGGKSVTGPDDETIQQIESWISENWTAAL